MVYLLPFLSYLAGSRSVSVRLPVLPGYDDKYHSRSYRFVGGKNDSIVGTKPLRRQQYTRQCIVPYKAKNKMYLKGCTECSPSRNLNLWPNFTHLIYVCASCSFWFWSRRPICASSTIEKLILNTNMPTEIIFNQMRWKTQAIQAVTRTAMKFSSE